MLETKRIHYSAEIKVLAVKRHLINKETVSQICNELGIHPNLYNEWQSKFFTDGQQVFNNPKEKKALEKKVIKLSEAANHRDSVIAELVTELIDLKKSLGEN